MQQKTLMSKALDSFLSSALHCGTLWVKVNNKLIASKINQCFFLSHRNSHHPILLKCPSHQACGSLQAFPMLLPIALNHKTTNIKSGSRPRDRPDADEDVCLPASGMCLKKFWQPGLETRDSLLLFSELMWLELLSKGEEGFFRPFYSNEQFIKFEIPQRIGLWLWWKFSVK